MIITTENINNKILLAGCCLADKAVDYIQAVNLGDIDKQECLMEKMQNLVFLRKALCGYLPYSEAGARVSGAFNIGNTSQNSKDVTMYLNGVQVAPTYTWLAGGSNLYNAQIIADYINSVQALITFSFSPIAENYVTARTNELGSGGDGDILEIVTVDINGTETITVTLSNGGVQPCLASTTDALAKKLIASIDELCGCPCGCNKNIIDDTLPKYIN
jgi:hypothetical protein